MRDSGVAVTLTSVGVILTLSASVARGSSDSGQRPVTVKDLIELSYVVNPTVSTYPELRDAPPRGVPLLSPDRKWFLLISQRGVLSTGQLEATLWLFSRSQVDDYLAGKTSERPSPIKLAVLAAESNTPVISEVRWLSDSNRVSFLGKEMPAEQRLYVLDLRAKSRTAITPPDEYVSQYAIANSTIVYTVLINTADPQISATDVVDVRGESIYALLFPSHRKLEDEDEWGIDLRPNELRLIKDGHECPFSFTFEGQPLRIFTPTLSLSPNGERLITVAAVHKLPHEWAEYVPAFDHDYLNLKPENKYALAEGNPWKAAEYVAVDLRSGSIQPILEAPAGRVLEYFAPTSAFWLNDASEAVLTNSFLPLDDHLGPTERRERTQSPALVMVNLADNTYQRIGYLRQKKGGFQGAKWFHVDDITWNSTRREITVTYQGADEKSEISPAEHYSYKSGSWIHLTSNETSRASVDEPNLFVREDLSHPPMLVGVLPNGAKTETVWDPNPQLNQLRTGAVRLYSWEDGAGHHRSGILAMPPHYEPGHRYPLVIQTHGYDANKYFADGEFTTGSGGRALNALGIVVLQMDMPMSDFRSPDDGPFALAGFESAINQLWQDGIIDRQRVGVIGFSYSCFHVLYAISHRPDLFDAATITDGNNMSYVQYVMSTDGRDALQEISEKTNGGMPFGDNLLTWFSRAPNFALDKVKTPLLISSFETGELLAQWETYSGLRRLRRPVDMIWLRKENAPHILVKPHERYISEQSAVDWFKFWLNGQEDIDPEKAEQYARWRELRRLAKGSIRSGGPQ